MSLEMVSASEWVESEEVLVVHVDPESEFKLTTVRYETGQRGKRESVTVTLDPGQVDWLISALRKSKYHLPAAEH